MRTEHHRGAERRAPRRWLEAGAGVLVLAVVATVAIVSSGYDARETPREEPSVWVARSSGQYARVNTDTAEIDTVRRVDDPSGVVQAGALGVIVAQGNGRAWAIDAASPRDLVARTPETAGSPETGDDDAGPPSLRADPGGGVRAPDGTRSVLAADSTVLFHTERGEVYLGAVEPGSRGVDPQRGETAAVLLGDPRLVDPDAGGSTDGDAYRADAAALDRSGRVALFSAAEHAVRWIDAASGAETRGADPVPEEIGAEGIQLAIVAGDWVLLDAAAGRLWRSGRAEAVELPISADALLQSSSAAEAGPEALVADESALWSVSPAGSSERLASGSGIAARPESAGTGRVAAWLAPGGGTMWTSERGERPLVIEPGAEPLTDPEPVIRGNGSRAVLADTGSGMLWTVPDGLPIPLEQWSLMDPPKQEQGAVVTQDVTEQEPPVAVDDAFGVRPGEQVLMPVLLNDFDPNRSDALTIVPEGLGEGLPPEFGAVGLLADAQGVTVRVSGAARGSASFRYRITDGLSLSDPAEVTLTVAEETVNTAPEWCPVEGCQRAWPSPELAPGGTLVLPLLDGWVDPEGDPLMLAAAEPVNPDDPVRALVTPDGRLAVRHTDPNSGQAEVPIRVRVEDARGQSRERELRVRVRPGAAMEVPTSASTVTVGEDSLLHPLARVTGGSGSFALVDATVHSGGLGISVSAGGGTIEASADAPGGSVVVFTVRDTITDQETTGRIRVTAVETRAGLGLPPLRAFVRPLADTTIDVLEAVPGAGGRALAVQSASVIDGQLRADVVEHARIRVSGTTPDGGPGRIGSADVVVAEGDTIGETRLTVFQLPETSEGGVIAVTDTATVRAGSVVDIPVLDNDVSPPGDRLVLHPEVASPGAPGELAFASGTRVRYLAPSEPGIVTLSYTSYGVSAPEQGDVGQVRVTVLPAGTNRAPHPETVTVRVAPGERARVRVPLSGVDPDGDRVRLVSVGVPEYAQLSASLLPRSAAVQLDASDGADAGIHLVPYTVRDSAGAEAVGRIRVVVTPPDPGGGAPVLYSDYVRISSAAAQPVTVRPLENDLDPSGGELELLSVVPNVPGDAQGTEARALLERLDLSGLQQGIVRIAPGRELGTVSFRYTARSSTSTSTADGLIVVQVSARVGQQAPTVSDTVLSVRDRSEFARSGVDVVTDRVAWAAGDAGALALSVWGPAAERYRVSGSKIIGAYRAEGDLVPFRLAGLDATGTEVESFGFLIVPPLDELRLSLRPGLAPLSVAEGGTVSARIDELVDVGADDRVVLREGSFPVQRGQASCTSIDAGGIRYAAGRDAPWSDVCTIQVRLSEQRAWTTLTVPVQIVPDAPVARLQAITRTISPGETQTVELTDMVEWLGGRQGDTSRLSFGVSGAGGGFAVAQSGSALTVTARADAPPGAQQSVSVSVGGSGESRATLTLRVGEAPRDIPRGATISLQCTVGAPCQAEAVGRPGEHDPFAGRGGGGLHLVAVEARGCAVGRLRAAGESIVVDWPEARGPGGRCTAAFTVRDAQNRTGTGTIEFDAQGVPRAPAAITQTGYSRDAVLLEVQLGRAASAHPAVTGVAIERDGAPAAASCDASGASYRCRVAGLAPGEKHRFTARAVNAAGESEPAPSAVVAWAYVRPAAPEVRAEQVSAESAASGTVRVAMTAGDETTGGYRVSVGPVTRTVDGRDTQLELSGIPVGDAAFTVVPLSRHEPPSGDSADGAPSSGRVNVGGRPSVTLAATSSPGSDRVSIVIAVNPNGGGAVTHGFGTAQRGSEPSCSPRDREGSGGSYEESGRRYVTMRVLACAENRWGNAEAVATELRVGGDPAPPVVEAGYQIGVLPVQVDGGVEYRLAAAPSVVAGSPDAELHYRVQGIDSDRFPDALAPETRAEARVRQCIDGACSDWAEIPGNVPASVRIDLSGCVAPGDSLPLRVSAAARASAAPSYDTATSTLTVAWLGPFAGLETLAASVPACPGPEPPADGS